MSRRNVLLPFVLAALYAVSLACTSGTPGTGNKDGGPDPLACDADGVYMAIYGKATQAISTGDSADLKVVLAKRGQGHVAADAVEGHSVGYQLASGAPSDFSLSATSVDSDVNGIAKVTVTAGQTAASNVQIIATTGSCNVSFTVQVKKPQRHVAFVGPNPRDAYTNTKVGITAQASTDNGMALANEIITIALDTGKTTSMRLDDVSGSQQSTTELQVTTGNDGRGTVRLDTGTEVATLTLRADLSGTASATVEVDILDKSTSGCAGDQDCPAGQICVAGICAEQTAGCQSDSDCQTGAHCVAQKCVQPDPSGTPCQCIPSANKCVGCNDAAGEVCIGGYCTQPPAACTDNSQCPIGWLCQNGTCIPGVNGCSSSNPCPTGMLCVAGQCQPPGGTDCQIPGRPGDRLAGAWSFDSTLHLRNAVSSFFQGFLQVASYLNQVMSGSFGLSGIPSWLTDIVGGFIQDLMSQYLPPWGMQLISALSDINDILNDMRVWSTVNLTSGTTADLYRASEHWDLVGFKYRGTDIISAPEDIPEVGTVDIDDYVAREVCGTFYADKHDVHNAVGGLVKWAIEVALTAITCSTSGPCYTSIDDALQGSIDCDGIAQGIQDLIDGIVSSAPDVTGAVSAACSSLLTNLIAQLDQTLQNIVVQLSLMSLRGQSDIDPLPADIPMPLWLGDPSATPPTGVWYGTLAGGNFDGTFSAKRQ